VRVVGLVPRRADGARRDQLWRWARERWPFEVVEGSSPDGPFNRSAAINDAARKAGDWDIAAIIDADTLVPQPQLDLALRLVEQADESAVAQRDGLAVLPFTHYCLVSRKESDRLLAGRELPGSSALMQVRVNRWSGCVVVPRALFEAVGGFDERFVGWGGEDISFAAALLAAGTVARLPGNLYHLWHQASSERTHKSAEYLRNAMLERRYVHALSSQIDAPRLFDDPPDYGKRSELIRRELAAARGVNVPDWSSWWPSMDELLSRAEPVAVLRAEGSIALVAHTDGRREYLQRTMTSLEKHVSGAIRRRLIWDDSGDAGYQRWLARAYPAWEVVGQPRRLGYTRSMQALWRYLSELDEEYVFRTEDDFVFEQPVNLDELAAVLSARPYLRQIALLRQAWFPEETAAGGVIEATPDAFERVSDAGQSWIEHRTWWTANPSLFRRELTARYPWPSSARSEWRYSRRLVRDPVARMAYWGDGTPWVTHIGEQQAGTGY
jgi:hypothetical protein